MNTNLDFRNGAQKSGHLDDPLQSYGHIYVTRAVHNLLATPKHWVANRILFGFWNITCLAITGKKLGLKTLRARALGHFSRWGPYVWGWFWCIIVTGISSGVREIEIWKDRILGQISHCFFYVCYWVISGRFQRPKQGFIDPLPPHLDKIQKNSRFILVRPSLTHP